MASPFSRKILPSLALMVLGTLGMQGAAGQTSFTLGPKAGFTSSHLTTNVDTLETDFKQGFQAGLFFRVSSGVFYLQPEVMYVTKGGVFKNEGVTFREDIFLHSIDVPLIFGLKLGEDELNFRFFGGPVASWVIEKEIELSGQGAIGALENKNIKDSFLGAEVGIGIDLTPFSLDVRYEAAYDNIYVQTPNSPDLRWQSQVFNISLALKLF